MAAHTDLLTLAAFSMRLVELHLLVLQAGLSDDYSCLLASFGLIPFSCEVTARSYGGTRSSSVCLYIC